MPKTSGLGDNLYVGGVDLSGDIGSIGSVAGGNSPLDVTAIDKSAMERLGGKRDGNLEFTAFFNPDAGQAHPVLSALPTADVIVCYFRGTTLGGAAACMVGKQLGYDPTRNEDGSLTFKVQAQANGFGLEWGTQLTPGKRTDAAATNGPGVDLAAGTNFGMQGYLHVFAFTGVDVTVKVQHSNDNGSVDPYVDIPGSQFAQITTGPQAVRSSQFGLTNKRWLRVVTTTIGGFTNLVFAVVAVRNFVSTVF